MVGTVSRTARVSGVTRNLKEAASKVLARRTGIAYEAATSGQEGTKTQSPITIWKVWKYMRRVYGTKVTRITLGGLPTCLVLLASRDVGMGEEKSAEAVGAGLTNRQRAEHDGSNRSLGFR